MDAHVPITDHRGVRCMADGTPWPCEVEVAQSLMVLILASLVILLWGGRAAKALSGPCT